MADILKLLIVTALFSAFCIVNPVYAQPDEKHYINEKEHFELSYPADLIPEINKDGDLHLSFPSSYIPKAMGSADLNSGVVFNNDGVPIGADKCFNEKETYPSLRSSQAVTINNIDFKVMKGGDAGMGSGTDVTFYRVLHKGFCYQVELTIFTHAMFISECKRPENYIPKGMMVKNCPSVLAHADHRPDYEAILKRIVSTFKFMD